MEHLLPDSRRLIFPDTSLFFALKGPRRDGRLFMEELYRRGVRNFIVQDDLSQWAGEADVNIIRVQDTLAALQHLAALLALRLRKADRSRFLHSRLQVHPCMILKIT